MSKLSKEYASMSATKVEENKKVEKKEEKVVKKPVIKRTTVKLNVRKEPGGEIVKVLNRGDKVTVDVSYVDEKWTKLKDGNFVMTEFLEG